MLHVLERGGVEIGEIAVKIVRVGPVAKGHRREIEPGKAAIGLIQHVHANFFLDHVALIAQIFVVHLQGAHAVGLEPQHAFERVGRNGFVVVGDVVVRRAIQNAAGRIDQLDMHHLSGVFRALKHHVLEKVREAAAAARLQAKANVVIDAEGGHRRGAVRRYDHAQAIFEFGAFQGNVQSFQWLSFKECVLSMLWRCGALFDCSEYSLEGQLLRAAVICQNPYGELG